MVMHKDIIDKRPREAKKDAFSIMKMLRTTTSEMLHYGNQAASAANESEETNARLSKSLCMSDSA